MSKICLCLTAKTLQRDLEILDRYREYVDMAELRVDCLDPDERFLIRRFPEQAGVPAILTIRRDVDGGCFASGEAARVGLMARGLAFAETDRRRNFAYIDIEEDLNVPSLEEAARTFGTRIIRSYHNINGTDPDLATKIRSMHRTGDDIVKIAIKANSTRAVLDLLRAGKKCGEQEKILIAMGHYGVYSRILADQFGSYMTYTSALSEPDIFPGAPGQIDVQELARLYQFRNISGYTRVFGVTGYPLTATGSPFFFNTIFGLEGINAVYAPFPADSIADLIEIAKELKVEGLSVTVPYKEKVISFLSNQGAEVRRIGACNTLTLGQQGWMGTNTDTRGFSDSLLAFLNKTSLKRQRVTVIGAGGAAKAVVFELYRLGAKVLVLNRTAQRARSLASQYKFNWGGLDDRGIAMMDKYRDIIIQTTSAGMEGTASTNANGSGLNDPGLDPSGLKDPVIDYAFTGHEEVMDLVYKPKMTPFLKRAAAAGCRVQNGYDMLIRQAQYQYAQFTGKDFPEHLLARVNFGEN